MEKFRTPDGKLFKEVDRCGTILPAANSSGSYGTHIGAC